MTLISQESQSNPRRIPKHSIERVELFFLFFSDFLISSSLLPALDWFPNLRIRSNWLDNSIFQFSLDSFTFTWHSISIKPIDHIRILWDSLGFFGILWDEWRVQHCRRTNFVASLNLFVAFANGLDAFVDFGLLGLSRRIVVNLHLSET